MEQYGFSMNFYTRRNVASKLENAVMRYWNNNPTNDRLVIFLDALSLKQLITEASVTATEICEAYRKPQFMGIDIMPILTTQEFIQIQPYALDAVLRDVEHMIERDKKLHQEMLSGSFSAYNYLGADKAEEGKDVTSKLTERIE